jgi:hypothetical protein
VASSAMNHSCESGPSKKRIFLRRYSVKRTKDETRPRKSVSVSGSSWPDGTSPSGGRECYRGGQGPREEGGPGPRCITAETLPNRMDGTALLDPVL